MCAIDEEFIIDHSDGEYNNFHEIINEDFILTFYGFNNVCSVLVVHFLIDIIYVY